MKKLGILIFFLLLGASTEVSAWNYGQFISCNALNPMPTITLKTSYGELVHDFNLTTKQLTAKGRGMEKEGFIEGLATRNVYRLIALKKYTVKKLDDTATCILPAEVEITIAYKNPEIYVSKDLDFQSCRFSVAIRHEQVHQRINKLVLDYFLPLFFDELKIAVRDVKAIKVSSPEEAEEGAKKLINYYHKRLDPVFNIYLELLKNEQEKLDNLTNYKMEWDLCKKFEEKHPVAKKQEVSTAGK